MNIIMFQELAQEVLQGKLDREIKLPSQEEIGEVTGNRTSNLAVVRMEESQTCEGAIDITTIVKEDKVVALRLEITLLKTSLKWVQQTI